jgi:hypothetical protein
MCFCVGVCVCVCVCVRDNKRVRSKPEVFVRDGVGNSSPTIKRKRSSCGETRASCQIGWVVLGGAHICSRGKARRVSIGNNRSRNANGTSGKGDTEG